MKIRNKIATALAALTLGASMAAMADSVQDDGSIGVTLQLNTPGSSQNSLGAVSLMAMPEGNQNSTMQIKLQKLSPALLSSIKSRMADKTVQETSSSQTGNSASASIPMGSVNIAKGLENSITTMPVFNQAQTETCATFSSTASIEILNGGKDQYSIYKSLQLGIGLSDGYLNLNAIIANALDDNNKTSFPNPWYGSYAEIVMSQFASYGLYPQRDCDDQDGTFGVSEDQTASLSANTGFSTIPDVKYELLFNAASDNGASSGQYVQKIKDALNSGKLVLVGVAVNTSIGNTGMTAKYYSQQSNLLEYPGSSLQGKNDVWYYSPDVANANNWNSTNSGGHALVVIGYIDAKDSSGDGLLIVRNSWGAENGDTGNNYIDYNYFKNLGENGVAVSM